MALASLGSRRLWPPLTVRISIQPIPSTLGALRSARALKFASQLKAFQGFPRTLGGQTFHDIELRSHTQLVRSNLHRSYIDVTSVSRRYAINITSRTNPHHIDITSVSHRNLSTRQYHRGAMIVSNIVTSVLRRYRIDIVSFSHRFA